MELLKCQLLFLREFQRVWQPSSNHMVHIVRLAEPWGRGPWILDLMGPLFNQHSDQKLRLLSCPSTHLILFLKTDSPFLKLFQVEELGSFDSFLALIHCLEQYLNLRTLAHWDSFSVWNLQLSLARRAVFLPLADWRPKPPQSLGLVTISQLT